MVEKGKEELREAAQLLLENRWILRKDQPEAYFLVRKYEKRLREFFREKCGWPLLVNTRFYKLEKVPAVPRGFLGISEMQTVEDYILLCCVMAFLEEQDIEGQFLLGDLCEALLGFYPQEQAVEKLNWESYNWRKALIRIMNYLIDQQIIRIVEDESEGFLTNGMTADGTPEGEALYEVTVLARSFLRSYPKDLKKYAGTEDLCLDAIGADSMEQEGEGLRRRRQRIYRTLLLEPAFAAQDAEPGEFSYLRNQYKRLHDELEEMVDLELELYQDTAMLVSRERNTWFQDIFPVRMRGIHDILLHISYALREQGKHGEDPVLSGHELEQFLLELQKTSGSGWTKEFREMSGKKLADTVLEELCGWGMAKRAEDGLIHLRPPLFRLSGRYPSGFDTGEKEAGGKKRGVK